MSSGQIENKILDAIQTVVDSAVQKAGYDKTISATIVKCSNEALGKYVIRYQDGLFNAYSQDPSIKYNKGTQVYILIPRNDTSATKTILGTVDKLGSDFIETTEGDSIYDYVGNNIISSTERVELCTYNPNQIVYLYDRSGTHQTIEDVTLDLTAAELYLKRSEFLTIGAFFQTAIPVEQRIEGNYGIVYKLTFKDNATGADIQRTYRLDINNMLGDPYDLAVATRQFAVFEIDTENFKSIDEIYVFQENFPKTETGHRTDIYIGDFELCGANPLERDEISDCSLAVITPQGIYFDNNDAAAATRNLEAQVRVKGSVVNPTSDTLKYYWFKENNAIVYTSPQFQRYGGQGWECLNDFTEPIEGVRAWIPASYKFITRKSANPAQENKYKCVAVYNDNIILTKEVAILNMSSAYTVEIDSSNGNTFHMDTGSTTLTCNVTGGSAGDVYTYSWSMVDAYNNFIALDTTTNNITVEARSINQFVTYKCIVSINGDVIGRASIVLSNILEAALAYSINIENGNQVFKYNTAGISPASKAVEHPIDILPLSIQIYDDKGVLVSDESILSQNVTWKIPKEKTLLNIPIAYVPTREDEEYKYYEGYKELNFNIHDKYNIRNVFNDIQVIVNYQDKILIGKTDLTFVKEGDLGTNGTEFVCKLVPNVNVGYIEPENLMYTYNEDTSAGSFNIIPAIARTPLKIEFYHNENLIYTGIQSGVSVEEQDIDITWSVLKNKYNSTHEDSSNFTIDEDNGQITVNNVELDNPANIIKAEINYGGNTYYATYPIIFARVKDTYAIELKDYSGFKYAIYASDGTQPQYDNLNPFEITMKLNEEEFLATSYTWTVKGSIFTSEWESQSNLIERHLLPEINQKYYQPIDRFDGMCVNNGLYCVVKDGSVAVAKIHIPVHLLLNRYGHAAINGWDGNTIQLKEDEGIILSPQVGAGHKETDNSFTGVLMGSVKEGDSDKIETGLFGYNHGERTINLNAETGTAVFGKANKGQIVLVPGDNEEDHAYLRSGDYALSYERVNSGTIYNSIDLYFRKENDNYIELKKNVDYIPGETTVTGSNIYRATLDGSGLEIDLTDPHIRFGSGQFRIDSDGVLHAPTLAPITRVEAIEEDIEVIEDTITTFNVTADAEAINIPCTVAQTPVSSLSIPITFKGTFKGQDKRIIEGSGYEQCTIQINTTHQGIQLTKQFDATHQNIIITVNQLEVISSLINSYIITFTYKDVDGTLYSIEKSLNITLAKQGEQGAKGDKGDDGKDGTSVTIQGSYAYLQLLLNDVIAGRVTPVKGDAYIIDHNLYVYTNEGGHGGTQASDWKDVGQFKGMDAKKCFIVASSEVFRSDDGGTIYTPSSIAITPFFQSVTYSTWAYSSDGGSTWDAISDTPPQGISIDSQTKILTIQNNCILFTINESIVFKCETDDLNVYDTITISKLRNGIDGAPGKDGINTATLTLYTRSSSAITTTGITGSTTYKFSDCSWNIPTSSPANRWSKTIPSGNDPIYCTMATAASQNATDTVASTDWITPFKMAENGGTGPQGVSVTAVTQLYYLKTNSITPSKPTVHVTSTALTPNQWTTLRPTYIEGGIYYTCNEIAYSNSTYTWTSVAEDKGLNEAIATAKTAEETANTASSTAASAESTANAASSTANRAEQTANTASTNAADALAKANKSIKTETHYYQANSNSTGVTRQTTGWSTDMPTLTPTNKYLWCYIDYTLADGTLDQTMTPIILGAYGNSGTNAGSVNIYADKQQFIYDKDGNVDTTTITLNSSSPGVWSYFNGTTYVNISSSEMSSVSVAHNNTSYFYNSGKVAKFKISATVNGVACIDEYSLYKIYDGKQIVADGQAIKYQNSTSGTTVPTGAWSSTPNPEAEKYTWVQTTQYYRYASSTSGAHDAGSTVSYSVSYTGKNGTDGEDGKQIVADRAVIEYQNSTSGTTVPTGSWTSTPNPTKGQYTWTKTTTYYRYSTSASGTSDAGSTISYNVSYEGSNGTNSKTAYLTNEVISMTADKDGKVSSSGLTFTCNVVAYDGSTKTTPTVGTITGTPSIPSGMTVTKGSVSNNEIPITITISASSTLGSANSTQGVLNIPITSPVNTILKLTWNKINTGATGTKGDKGDKGDAGKGIASSSIMYAVGNDSVTVPSTWKSSLNEVTVADGQFLWTRTILTYTDNTQSPPSYSISYKAKNGDDGTSVTISSKSIDYGYSNSGTDSSSVPAQRTTSTPGGWGSTIPAVPIKQYLWTRTTVNYSPSGQTVSYSVSYHAEDGSDATQYYTHVMYANDSSGTGISSNPTGKSYIGVRIDTSQSASTNPGDYTWTKFVGADGINGYSIWTTTATPTTPNYTFNISSLTGPQGATPKVGEVIIRSNRYQYTITSVASTTVQSNTQVDLRGTDGTSATNIIVGSDSTVIPCDADWKTLDDNLITIPFTGFLGTTKKATTITQINSVTSITSGTVVATGITIQSYQAGTTSADGSLVLKFAKNSDLGNTKTGVLTIKYSCNSQTFTRYFTWSKTLDPNIQIGGRNYILNSNFAKGIVQRQTGQSGWVIRNGEGQDTSLSTDVLFNSHSTLHRYRMNTTATSWTENQYYYYRDAQEQQEDTTYTLSYWVFTDNADWLNVSTNGIVSSARLRDSEGQSVGEITLTNTKPTQANKWEKKVTTFTIERTKNCAWFYIFDSPARDFDYYMADFKLEKGNKATDWTPAPEDIEDDITSAATSASEAKAAAQEASSSAEQAMTAANNAQTTANNALEKSEDLNRSITNSTVTSTSFEYTTVAYPYTIIPIGTDFAENTIYYSYDSTKNIYTKVRPEVNTNNKTLNVYYTKGTVPSPSISPTIYTNKPAWEDGYRIYQRTILTYGDGTTKIGSWDLLDDYQTLDDIRYLDGNQILRTMRGTGYVYYQNDGLYCYNQTEEKTSTSYIVLNQNGICFNKRNSTSDPWPTPTSVWTIDGTFDAQHINVINLAAETIANGKLTLGGAGTDGGLIILNDAQDTMNPQYELNSQRFKCALNNGGYVLIGKDIGFQVLSANDEVQYGSQLTWNAVAAGTTMENNVNYYTQQYNFMSLIIPETPNQKVPTGKTYYTITCGNILDITKQRVKDSINFGDYIETINMNTVDSSNRRHRGIAFIAKQ